MEIWSSPAAYDELNGNAERGGGADPIARELEEGGGGPGGCGAAAGSGMRGRGLPSNRPTAETSRSVFPLGLAAGSPPLPVPLTMRDCYPVPLGVTVTPGGVRARWWWAEGCGRIRVVVGLGAALSWGVGSTPCWPGRGGWCVRVGQRTAPRARCWLTP